MQDRRKGHYRDTISYLRRREETRQETLSELFAEAWRDFNCIINYIVEVHRPKRIWQWGSLLERKKFSEISDLDIAIEGLSSASGIFDIIRKAEEISDFPVDIIELEKTAPEYRELLKLKGRLVYGNI